MREAQCVTTMLTWPVSSMDSVAGPLPLEPEAEVSAPAPSETDPPSHTSAPPNDAPGYLDDLDEVDNIVPQWQPRQEFSESTPSLTSTELFEEEQNRIALREWEEGIYQLKMGRPTLELLGYVDKHRSYLPKLTRMYSFRPLATVNGVGTAHRPLWVRLSALCIGCVPAANLNAIFVLA